MILYNKQGQKIKIDDDKEIARGGEGRVMDIGRGRAAKLYHDDNPPITPDRFKSLFLLDPSTFTRPLELLFNSKKQIVGFIMDMLSNDYFPLYSAYSNNFCKRHGVDEKIKIKIVKKLISSVDYAHKKNIVIGDLNPFNIMINDTGVTSFIDVDSYQTPGTQHSGKLLDDIRDHLYMGHINNESDYFALAVITFNFLTNMHPFKGVHGTHKSIQERMLQRIPVFDNDSQLKVPKCYHPLKDKNLMEQYKRIFKEGQRFLISTDATSDVLHVINIDKIVEKEGELSITKILSNEEIRYVNASNTIACVANKTEIIVYDLKDKGYYRELGRIPRTSKDLAPLPTDKNLFTYEKGKFFKYDLKTFEKIEMDDMGISKSTMSKQYGNVFIVVENDRMYIIYLDEVIGTHLKYDTKDVFGGSFKKYNGVMQHFGGNTYIRANSKGRLDTVLYDGTLSDVYQVGDMGITQTVEKGKISFDLFKINGLKVDKYKYPLTSIRHFGCNPGQFVIMPEDDQLVLLRHDNLQPIAKFKCSIVDESTQVFYTKAGILLNDGNNLWLVNKK